MSEEKCAGQGPKANHTAPSASTDELADAVKKAVADGIKAAVSDPETVGAFWASGLTQLQRGAQQQTGRFVLFSIKGIGSRALQFLLLGSIVYSLGGWTAVAKLWHTLWSGNS